MENKIQPESIGVIYHANCTDGYTAAWCVEHAYRGFNSTVVLRPYNYDWSLNDALALAQEVDWLYIVDFSFKRHDVEALAAVCTKVILLDHHKTAFQHITGANPEDHEDEWYYEHFHTAEQDITYVLDNKRSGALLTWCWLHNKPATDAPVLVRYVSDYDLWKFHYGDATKFLDKYLRIQPQTYESWNSVESDLNEIRKNEIIERGKAIQEYHNKIVANIAPYARPIILAGIEGMGVAAPYVVASDLGHALAGIKGSYGAMWYQKDNNYIVSLRSEGKVDVADLAKKFGGGGHANAAGFSIPVDMLNWDVGTMQWSSGDYGAS